jgi:hypothetical protein
VDGQKRSFPVWALHVTTAPLAVSTQWASSTKGKRLANGKLGPHLDPGRIRGHCEGAYRQPRTYPLDNINDILIDHIDWQADDDESHVHCSKCELRRCLGQT